MQPLAAGADPARSSICALGQEQPPSADQAAFAELVVLGNKHRLSLREVKQRRNEFNELDVDQDGMLSMHDLENMVRGRCSLSPAEPIPPHLCNSLTADADQNGSINFKEFLSWWVRTAFAEDMLVSDPQERWVREIARTFGVCLPDVEHVKTLFDKFDVDHSGVIDEEEFTRALMILMKVTNPRDVPPQKLKRFFREVDADNSGEITFEEFLVWYCMLFE